MVLDSILLQVASILRHNCHAHISHADGIQIGMHLSVYKHSMHLKICHIDCVRFPAVQRGAINCWDVCFKVFESP